MKTTLKRILLAAVIAAGTMTAWADSPLTSTEFWRIYKATYESENYFPPYISMDKYGWGPQVMNILCDEQLPLEQRLCLVNYIGWNINGQGHFAELCEFYRVGAGELTVEDALNKISPDMLIILAYVLALDNYFDVKDAQQLAAIAYNMDNKSRAIAMIYALITAQVRFDEPDGWGDVYRVCHEVETATDLRNDFSDAAIWSIMSYINLYKEYTEEPGY